MTARETITSITGPAKPDHAGWRDHYHRWQNGELSKAAYCREYHLNAGQFYYYCRLFSAEESSCSPAVEQNAGAYASFIPVAVSRDPEPVFRLQVADVTLSCSSAVSAETLSQWLRSIRSTL